MALLGALSTSVGTDHIAEARRQWTEHWGEDATVPMAVTTSIMRVQQILLARMNELLKPLESAQWMFLLGVALLTMVFGMVLEGLPAAVVLIPVVFPIATKIGVNPIHFDIVQTAAVGIGLFLPPMGVGLLMALRFANVSVGRHARAYWPYVLALLAGLMLIIAIPELSLFLPRSAGMIR